MTLQGVVDDTSNIRLDGGIDITKSDYQMDFNLFIDDYDLSRLNKLLRHYVPIDVTTGSLSVFAEIKGKVSSAKGYVRVFLKDLNILKLDQSYLSTRHFFFEWIGGFVNWVLDAITDGDVATEIPFYLKKGKTDFSTSEGFWNALKNSNKKIPRKFKNI